ncbi:hypothetical protein [Nocardia salmonicida]|uniref:hypothetical protein n=1 Tax=Nocardia salmonicida TaxID=53431 RepID=UPI003CEC3357
MSHAERISTPTFEVRITEADPAVSLPPDLVKCHSDQARPDPGMANGTIDAMVAEPGSRVHGHDRALGSWQGDHRGT